MSLGTRETGEESRRVDQHGEEEPVDRGRVAEDEYRCRPAPRAGAGGVRGPDRLRGLVTCLDARTGRAPGGYRVNYRDLRAVSPGRSGRPGRASGELPSRSAAEPVLGDPRRDLGPGAHLQLAPDVLDVRLGRARRDRQAGGDGVLVSPSATSAATSSSRPVSCGPAAAPGSPRKPSIASSDRGPVAVVEEVARARQRDQRRARDERGDLPAQLEPGGRVRLAVQHRGARPDRRQQRPDVGARSRPPGAGRPPRPRRWPAGTGRTPRSPPRGVGDEDAGQHLRAPGPSGPAPAPRPSP